MIGHFLIITLYVEDMLLFGKSNDVIRDFKSHLSKQFDMKELGFAKYILGMEINRDRENIKLCLTESKYVNSVL
jgi:ATP-binding cassette subfamily B (MDR/TAP) protein 1